MTAKRHAVRDGSESLAVRGQKAVVENNGTSTTIGVTLIGRSDMAVFVRILGSGLGSTTAGGIANRYGKIAVIMTTIYGGRSVTISSEREITAAAVLETIRRAICVAVCGCG